MKSSLALTLLLLSCAFCTSSTFYHQSDNSVKIKNDNHLSGTNLTSKIITHILDNYELYFNNTTNDLLRKEPLINYAVRKVFNYLFKLIKYRGKIHLPPITKRLDSRHYFEAWEGMFYDLNSLIREDEHNMYNDKNSKTFDTVLNLRMPSAHTQYKYEAKFGIYWISGYVWVDINNLSINLNHEIHYGAEHCFQTIRNIRLNFNDIDINLSGLGIFDKIVGQFAKLIIMDNKDDLLEIISNEFKVMFEVQINELVDCDGLKFIFVL